MKKKPADRSISRALLDVLEFGQPTNEEIAELHFDGLRARKADPIRSVQTHGGTCLCLPARGFASRDLTVSGPAGTGPEWVGRETQDIISDLLSWSACVRQGATVLTGLRGRAHIPLVTKLVEPEWTPEIGMSVGSDVESGQMVHPNGWPHKSPSRTNCSRKPWACARQRSR